jgi:hypothetical protein
MSWVSSQSSLRRYVLLAVLATPYMCAQAGGAEGSLQERFGGLARPIGRLEITGQRGSISCTAAVISRSHILTVQDCIGREDLSAAKASIRLGSVEPNHPDAKVYPVRLPAVESNRQLGFAVLEVEGEPARDFGMVNLQVREPVVGEPVVIFQFGPDGSPARTSNCKVMSGGGLPDFSITHSCAASVGSSGALLFSETDNTVLGINSRARPAEGKGMFVNTAHSMTDILRASPLVAGVAWVRALPPRVVSGQGNQYTLSLPEGLPEGISDQSSVTVNGKLQQIVRIDPARRIVTLLGDDDSLRKGLNVMEILRAAAAAPRQAAAALSRRFIFWNEERSLTAFQDPYRHSYAIIVAIDDYDRASDPQRRGPTGYPGLKNMRERAEELRSVLGDLGFPDANIATFYDDQATAKNIDDALGEFWQGGRFADADRLVFYFGGHGDGSAGSGYLVPYDIDRNRPTRTGFLMSDFVGRHFPNILAHHVLVALDACGSGLAIPGTHTLAGNVDERRLVRLATLATIRGDTEDAARNLLVAGTGEQRALWETGGIFTQALIEGLRGNADIIKDGVIQFDELSLFVDRKVRARAAAIGVRQDPGSFMADRFGRGKILFMLPEFK